MNAGDEIIIEMELVFPPRPVGHLTLASSRPARSRRKRPDFRQHFLKGPRGATGTRVVADELLGQEDLPTPDGAEPALDAGLGWEAPAAFRCALERTGGFRRICGISA